MSHASRFFACLMVATLIVAARAEEGGAGHYAPGSFASFFSRKDNSEFRIALVCCRQVRSWGRRTGVVSKHLRFHAPSDVDEQFARVRHSKLRGLN
jgi:hypothetical protein